MKKFSWDKLPKVPFDFGEPEKLHAPLISEPFEWPSPNDTVFTTSSLPSAALTVKTVLLGQPKIIKAGTPEQHPAGSRGVLGFGVNLGLPGHVTTFMFDKNGQLWVGTLRGLVRYDGENFHVYAKEQGLKTGPVTSILQDDQGRIWVGYDDDFDNLYVLNEKAGLVYALSQPFTKDHIHGMVFDRDGNLWVNNNNSGYLIVDLEAKDVKLLMAKDGLSNNASFIPFLDNQGRIWAPSRTGVSIFDINNKKRYKLTDKNGLPYLAVFTILESTDGKIWLGGPMGVSILDKNKSTLTRLDNTHLGEDNLFVTALHQDHAGRISFSGSRKIFTFDEAKGTLLKSKITIAGFTNTIVEGNQGQLWVADFRGNGYMIDINGRRPGNFTTADGLGSNSVWGNLQASDGKFWIGTYEGIDIYDPETGMLTHLDEEHGLIHERSSDLFEDRNGRIWVTGNFVGISIVDPVRETITQVGKEQGLPSNGGVTVVEQDNNGLMWVGTQRGEVFTVDEDLKTVSIVKSLPETGSSWVVNILADSKNNIWVASRGSLGRLEVINQNDSTLRSVSSDDGLSSDEIFAIILETDEKIWIATERGVDLLNLSDSTTSTFGVKQGLQAEDVYDIIQNDGATYLGTSKGLTILTQSYSGTANTPVWRASSVGKSHGLTALDFAQGSFMVDDRGRLWAGSEDLILTVIDKETTDTLQYPTHITGVNVFDDPLKLSNKKLLKETVNANDTLWMPNSGTYMRISDATIDSISPAANDVKWASTTGAYHMPTDLTLQSTANFVSFDYNSLQYKLHDQVVYRYILEGIDKTWSPVTYDTHSENYRDLPPGEYTFKVASKGYNGIWSDPAEFSFTILPPWWQSWWAYTLFACIFAGLVYGVIQYRSQWLKRENRILEERVTHRTAQLNQKIDELKTTQSQLIQSEKMASLGELTAGIAHEIQNPLNFVNNFAEVNTELIAELREEIAKGNIKEVNELADDIAENEQKIVYHGKRADAIVKGMLQHSRSSNNTKEPTDINALADEYLRLAYHGLRAKDKSFNATMKTEFDDTIGPVSIISQDIGRVVLNLITNAFYAVTEKATLLKEVAMIAGQESEAEKYEPTVTVITKKQNNTVLIQVKDNGNGIPQNVIDKIYQPFFTTKPTGQGTGLGLSMSFDIVTNAHGGQLKVETEEGNYTIFTIILPT